jgi:hypothetical protein
MQLGNYNVEVVMVGEVKRIPMAIMSIAKDATVRKYTY